MQSTAHNLWRLNLHRLCGKIVSMQKPQFVEDYIYHVYNRGVEERNVFLDRKDYLRFIHDLFEFNDESPASNVLYFFNPKSMEVQPPYIRERKPRKLLVEILVFTLMPNHFHLLIKQKKEEGIVRFMQKLGTGYTMYFNQRYERVGGLFQGRFKAVRVHAQAHFLHLPFYIHANPILKKYKIYGGSTSIDWREAAGYLENYRWSSYPDYIGKKNFPSVTSRDFLLDFFGGEGEYKKETEKLICEHKFNLEEIEDVALESLES